MYCIIKKNYSTGNKTIEQDFDTYEEVCKENREFYDFWAKRGLGLFIGCGLNAINYTVDLLHIDGTRIEYYIKYVIPVGDDDI